MSTTTTPYGVIITETDDYISFRLPPWVKNDERARIKSELDEWYRGLVGKAAAAASTAIVAIVHDEAARQGIELSIPDPPTVDELAAAADALGMLPSDITRKAEDARMG